MAIGSCTGELHSSAHVSLTSFCINLCECNIPDFTNSIYQPNVLSKNIICFHVVQVFVRAKVQQKYETRKYFCVFI